MEENYLQTYAANNQPHATPSYSRFWWIAAGFVIAIGVALYSLSEWQKSYKQRTIQKAGNAPTLPYQQSGAFGSPTLPMSQLDSIQFSDL